MSGAKRRVYETPEEDRLRKLSGRMLTRLFACEGEDGEQFEGHEVAQFLFRWIRRQDAQLQHAMLADYGMSA